MRAHNVVIAYESFRMIFELYGLKIEKAIVQVIIPFKDLWQEFFAVLDPVHSHFLTLKARKPNV